MKNINHNFSPEDELKAENELLRLKLETEYKMKNMEANLPPEMENDFLNHVYEWERQHATAKMVSVYSFLGNPKFRTTNELSKHEISIELKRIQELMKENSIALDFICEYNDELKYRFITEELFEHEIEDMRITGMRTCFIYEEFHPNHAYDLEEYSLEHIKNILSKKWDIEFCGWKLGKELECNGELMTKDMLSKKVLTFQEFYESIELIQHKIRKIDFSLETNLARVEASAKAELLLTDGTRQMLNTEVTFNYFYEFDMWVVNEIYLDFFN